MKDLIEFSRNVRFMSLRLVDLKTTMVLTMFYRKGSRTNKITLKIIDFIMLILKVLRSKSFKKSSYNLSSAMSSNLKT